jgi:hypothetical protein
MKHALCHVNSKQCVRQPLVPSRQSLASSHPNLPGVDAGGLSDATESSFSQSPIGDMISAVTIGLTLPVHSRVS